jgi:hypothetical protein
VAVLALASSLALAESTAQSQSPEPLPDVRALKASLRKNLLKELIPEMKSHRERLMALEQQQQAAQEFAGAAKARNERLTLEKQIAALEQEAAMLASRPAVENASRLAARIELKLSEAQLEGAQLDVADGSITGWGSANSRATWKLPAIPAGGYEVLLRCTGPSGDVVAKEAFYTLTSPCNSAEDKSIEHNLGTLRIRDGAGTFILHAAQPEKSAAWRVYSVVLVPSGL